MATTVENKAMLTPGEIAVAAVGVGEYKTSKPNKTVFLSAMLAGMFIGLGYVGYLIVNGVMTDAGIAKVVGAAVFPVGLILVLIAGADLFTGNTLISMALFNKKVALKDFVKNLSIVWLGNLFGALFLVTLIYVSSLFSQEVMDVTMQLAEKKAHLTFLEVCTRGIIANIIVSLCVYMTYAAKDIVGKVVLAFFPIWLFVISGAEHSIANMFVMPLGKLFGAEISWAEIAGNIIPATIGNVIGGLIISYAYYSLFIKDKKSA